MWFIREKSTEEIFLNFHQINVEQAILISNKLYFRTNMILEIKGDML